MFKATCVYHRDPFHPARHREIRELTGPAPIRALAPVTDRPFIILRNGQAILRADWDQPVRPGDLLSVVLLPQGGGDNGGSSIGRIILMIVVAVAAVSTGGAVGAAYGAGWGTAAQIAVGIVGSMLVNAMMPPPKPSGTGTNASDWKSASPTYNLAAQGNTARLEGAIPVQYGRMIAYPDFAAAPYVEYEGNEQYLYQLFCIGVGEYDIEAIRIEDTDISNFEEITTEIVGPNQPLSLFPAAVATSIEVSGQDAVYNTPIGPFTANPETTLATRISVDLVCAGGLYYAQDDGTLSALTITLLIEARQVDDLGAPLGIWFTLGQPTVSAATSTAQRYTFSYAVAAARYEVRLTRTTVQQTATRVAHAIAWTGLRSHLVSSDTFGNVTLLAVKARATNNLSSQSSRKFNVIATRKLPIWNGTTWSAPTATRAIAPAIADACHAVGVADSRIDLAGLLALDAVWAARGDTIDARFDSTGTFWDAVNKIAQAGRAKAFLQGGILYAVRDQSVTLPVALYSMRNIARGSLSLEFITPTDDTADAVELTYFDQTTWKPRRLSCKLPESAAARPAKVELFGVVNRQQAYQEGVYMAAANRYRRTLITFTTEMEGFIPSYGDLVALQHDVPQWGQVADAVAWVAISRKLTVAEPLVWADVGTHYIGLRRRDGSLSGPYEVSQGATADELILVADPEFTPYTGSDEERTHVVFGVGSEWRRLARILKVRPRDMTTVEITCVNEDPRVHSADAVSGPVLPDAWPLPAVPTRPILAAIYVSQSGNPESPVITVSWPPAVGADYYLVEFSPNATDWQRAGQSAGGAVTFSVPPGLLHVRARAFNSQPGPWVTWTGTAGQVPVPGKPGGLALVEAWLSTRARWQWSAAARATSYDVEIYAAAVLRRSFSTAGLTYDYDADQITADGGPWRSVEIRVRAAGPSGVSDWASLTSVNPQVGALGGIGFAAGYQQIIGTYTLPADTDFSGVLVAMSQTTGFDPADIANQVYDGYDQVFVLTRDPASQSLVIGDVWYLRIAAYDAFGRDGLTWSIEYPITIAGADASLTPEQVLEKLNASFVQGNVVLAGSGAITVYNGSPLISNRDFVLLDAGTISFQRYREGQYREYKSLKRVEVGAAPSGQTVTLPGWWDRQPSVTVSPQSLKSYAAAYGAQDQTWVCRADNLREDPAASGIWKFDAVAELHLASAAGSTSINQSTGDTSTDTWDSGTYTLPPNTLDITVNITVKSKRGTAAHTAEWYYRQVTASVYTYSPGGGWVVSGSKVVAMGTTLDGSLADSIGCYSLPAGTTQFYVHFVAADVGGTFSTGSDVYNYDSTDTVVGSNGTVGYTNAYKTNSTTYYGLDQNNVRDAASYGGYARSIYHMPAYTPPAGWEVTGVTYAYQWSGFNVNGALTTPDGTVWADATHVTYGGTWRTYTGQVPSYLAGTWFRPGSYDAEAVTAHGGGTNGQTFIRVKDVVATIQRRQLIANSATPVNAFTLAGYGWQIASASALATGAMNYMAVGD